MKFAKCFGIFSLLAGMLGLSSCTAIKPLEGMWLGTEQGYQAVSCVLEIKSDKFALYFNNILQMNTSFKLQGNLSEQEVKGQKIPIVPESDALYDMQEYSVEDAWAKVEELYYLDGEIHMIMRYILLDKKKEIVFSPYDESKDKKLTIYKPEDFPDLQGKWVDNPEDPFYHLQFKKNHLKVHCDDEKHFDGKFRLVKYDYSSEIHIVDADTKYLLLPLEIMDGLVYEDGKLILKTIIYDLGAEEVEFVKVD